MCAIFLKHGDELVEMVEQPYEAEDVLQQLLADYPNLLAGDQDSEVRKRWLLVKRELGVAAEEDAPDRFSLDHLFLDEEGVPTLIEVKRSSDTRIRREVVGQMLDYAANGAELWGLEKIRTAFESRYADAEAAARGARRVPPRGGRTRALLGARRREPEGRQAEADLRRRRHPRGAAAASSSSSTSRWSGPRSWRSRSGSTSKREATA